jgi:hypothetical protein
MTDLPSEAGPGVRAVSARPGGIATAAALAATGVFFIWRSWFLSFGDLGVPGPGLFPFLLGIALAGVACGIAVETMRSPHRGERVELGHRDVIVVFSALLAVSLLFEAAGAYVTLGAMTAVLLLVLARMSVAISIGAAGVCMIAAWIVFKILLGVQLPAGPF